MVRYEQVLEKQLISKWEKDYINYSDLKKYLSRCKKEKKRRGESVTLITPLLQDSKEEEKQNLIFPVEDKEDDDDDDGEKEEQDEERPLFIRVPSEIEKNNYLAFYMALDEEIRKVDAFYNSRVHEYKAHLLYLINIHKAESSEYLKTNNSNSVQASTITSQNYFDLDLEDIDGLVADENHRMIPLESLKSAFQELYRDMNLLSSYAVVNYTGFMKIIKKFNKNFPEEMMKPKYKARVEECKFSFESNSLIAKKNVISSSSNNNNNNNDGNSTLTRRVTGKNKTSMPREGSDSSLPRTLSNNSILRSDSDSNILGKGGRKSMAISRDGSSTEITFRLSNYDADDLNESINKRTTDFDSEDADDDELIRLTTLLENVFARAFCGGKLFIAKTMLLAKKGQAENYVLFSLGFQTGLVLILLVWFLWDCVVDVAQVIFWDDSSLLVYRGVLMMIVATWCWGFNLYIWDLNRVNYMYIFEFDPRNSFDYIKIFSLATEMSAFYFVNFLLFYKTMNLDLPPRLRLNPPYIYPAVLFAYFVLRVFLPLRERMSFLLTMKEMMLSPFGNVRFAEFYAADVCTSLVKVFVDLAFSVCYFTSSEFLNPDPHSHFTSNSYCKNSKWFANIVSPILIILPLWWRLTQCLKRYSESRQAWPHLANGLKYTLSQTVTFFSIFHPNVQVASSTDVIYRYFWIFALTISTLYTYWWDINMDWGLNRRNSKNFGLRDTLMYFSRHTGSFIYYICIVLDLILRFMWTLSLIPVSANNPIFGDTKPSFTTLLTSFLEIAEILRRCMWGMFRVEHEHLNNLEGYRRVDFIPLHFETAHKRLQKKVVVNREGVIWEVTVIGSIILLLTCCAIFIK